MSRTIRHCFSLDEVFARMRVLLSAELSVARGRADDLEKALAPDTRDLDAIAE